MGSERRKCFALMGLTAPTNQSIDNCPIPSLETCNKIRRRLFLFFQMLESLFPPLHWALSNPKGLRGPMINYTRNRNNKNNMLACHSFLLPLGGEAKAIYLTTWCLREDRFTHGSLHGALCSGIIHLDIFLRIIITRQFLFHIYLNATLNVLELSYNRNL